MEEIWREIQEQKEFVKKLLLGAAQIAASAVGFNLPGGDATVEALLAGAFGKVQSDAKAAGEAAAKKVADDLVALTTRFTDTEKLLDEARKELGLSTMEQEWAKKELERLSEELRGKLAAISTETQDKLKAAKDDRKEFERILMEEGKLTPEQIENLKGFTTEQILALIAAATGAAGAGAMASRGGKSRSQPEIDELYDKIGDLTTRLAALEATANKPA